MALHIGASFVKYSPLSGYSVTLYYSNCTLFIFICQHFQYAVWQEKDYKYLKNAMESINLKIMTQMPVKVLFRVSLLTENTENYKILNNSTCKSGLRFMKLLK